VRRLLLPPRSRPAHSTHGAQRDNGDIFGWRRPDRQPVVGTDQMKNVLLGVNENSKPSHRSRGAMSSSTLGDT